MVLEGLGGYSGFRVKGVFGPHVGENVEGMKVQAVQALAPFCLKQGIRVGILALPEGENPDDAAVCLAKAGVDGIWNVGVAPRAVPEGVVWVTRRWDGDMAHLRSAMKRQEICAAAQGGINV